jgi:4-amino-4-deoxy-L-arabinose transferase-like glycosyltransferase
MGIVQTVTARGESQTYDESNQLLSGSIYVNSGHFTMGLEQPPLLKLLWAVPVSFLKPAPPPPYSADYDSLQVGRDFLYRNRVPADTMLAVGRIGAVAISILLGVAIAFWAKAYFGEMVALFAVLLYSFDPNFIANGRYMKNDVGAALGIFAAVMVFGAHLMKPSRKLLLLSGVTLGLALATKYSALILLPTMLLLYAIQRWQEGRGIEIRECARMFGAIGLVAFLVVFTIYRFDVRPLGDSSILRRWFSEGSWALQIPIPALNYLRGMGDIGLKQTEFGLRTYLLGKQGKFGWWYMSPVALAVKTPLTILVLFAVATVMAGRRLARTSLRDLEFKWFLLVAAPTIYFAVTMFTNFNAGLRHLLPVYPFLFVFVAAVVLSRPVARWRWGVACASAALLVVECAAIHPHYLAFFNVAAGGPVGGPKILADSNLDWGQDVKHLKSYLDARGIPEIALSYYGQAEPEAYGIRYHKLAPIHDVATARSLDCVAVVSVTNLVRQPHLWAGLYPLQPDARIGYSIYLYDFRKNRDGTN